MMIIAFAASKGGCGKSTLCQLVASELACRDLPVVIMCTDPQHSAHNWYERAKSSGTLPAGLIVKRIDSEPGLKEELDKSEANAAVFIDVQGALNQFQTIAVVASDLTVVPCRATYMDVVEALKFFDYAGNLKRSNLRLVLNEVKTIDLKTPAFLQAVEPLQGRKIPMFKTMIASRSVYAQFSKDAGSLQSLATTPAKIQQVEKARANIASLAAEILKHAGY